MANHLPSQDAWSRARNRYIQDLTHEEKQLYMKATPETIFYDASAAQKSHEAGSTSRGLMYKLQPFVAAIEQYAQALDIYANAYPLALSPLWGSIRVLLKIAREFGKYFEKLVDMFARIGDVLPQFQVYEKLFPDHERLIHAISVVYVDIIVFCSDAKAIFRRGQRASLTSLKVGFKLIWKPFESQFGQQLDNFRTHRKNVEKEAGLSHMVEAADARALVLANHLQLEKSRKENEHQRIMAMIESVDVEVKHRKLQDLRYNGTGDWVLQNDKYLEWKHASSTSSLCCYGIPGSGKSVLASRIIDDLLITVISSKVKLVYYYCDFADQRTLQTDRILGTLLKQLLPEGRFPEELEPRILQAYGHGQRTPGTHEMEDLVCSLMQLHSVTYVVIDGLDECEKQARQELLNILKRISALGSTSVHTCVSCRDEDELLRSLHLYPRIQLTAEALGGDINCFVEGSVRSRIDCGLLKIQNPELEHHVVQELVKKAHGMFLWVFFQLDDLCEAISEAMIRQTLRDLPIGLVQTYERILLKISKVPLPKQEIALRGFKWMVCSRRPLKTEELQEAVAFDGFDHSWDGDKIPDKDLMIETCRGLLVRDNEDGAVHFAHYTVQQYLLSAPTIGSCLQISPRSEAEGFVGEFCLTYLSFSDFETQVALRTPNVQLEHSGVLSVGGPVSIPTVLGIGKWLLDIPYRLLGGKPRTAPPDFDYSSYLAANRPKRPQAPSTLTEKYRLLGYIVCYWMDHTQVLEPALNAKLCRLVMYKTLSFEFRPWGPNQHFGPYGCGSCPDPTKAKELPFMSLFHYAAHTGHWSLMESLVTEYCQHEQPFDETFLIACRQGQDMIVRHLMREVNIDISDGRAVNVAATAGQADVLKFLLDSNKKFERASFYNVNPNASSLLNLAATNGHENVIDTIFNYYDLARDSYVNKIDEHSGRTALLSAVMNGHENVVRKLLANGAEIKTNGTTAIHIAAEYGYQNILRILFKATSKHPDSNSGTKLKDSESESSTSDIGFQDSLTLLRLHDTERDTPLHKAARNGHFAAVKTIVEHQPTIVDVSRYCESDSNGKMFPGLTAFHLAASRGHLSVLKILANGTINVNKRAGQNSETAVNLAVANGHQPVVEWLLEIGAETEAMTNETKALELACDKVHDTVRQAVQKKSTETPRFDPEDWIKLIESISERKMAVRLGVLLDDVSFFVRAFGEGYLKKIVRMAKTKGYRRALAFLEFLLGDQRWERDVDPQGLLTIFAYLDTVP